MALLIIIYVAFISLGLPDGVLGSIWPVMRFELNLPLWTAGLVGMVGSLGTVVSALNSYRLIHRFGTAKVTYVSVCMTAVSLLGFSFASSLPVLLFLAIPLGLGAGSVDSALNNYVALHYKARHMNWLHSFWGLGASSGPLIMGVVLSYGVSYRYGYRLLGLVQVLLVVALVVSRSLWSDSKPVRTAAEEQTQPRSCIKAIPFAMLSFFFYCALEVSTGLWAVSYLVEVKQLPPETAAFFGSLFFLGITSGRMVSGFISFRLSNLRLIALGLGLCFISVALLFVSSLAVSGFSLLLLGIGCAPIFPSMIHETPRSFGGENSQRIIGLQMASAYVGSAITPPLFGLLGSTVGLVWMPFLQLCILCLLALCILLLFLFVRARHQG